MSRLWLCLVLAFLVLQVASLDLAIIGAGIGGSSAAYFARETLGNDVKITVFEKSEKSGGRVHDVDIGGVLAEAGASIYHKVNKYVASFVNRFNLSAQVVTGGRFAIWNGKEFIFEESDITLLNYAKLFWRYALSPLKLRSATEEVLQQWQQIYDLFDKGEAYSTVESWLDAVNLTKLIREELRDHLLTRGSTQLFIDELITAVTRVQYGQDASLHALVGLVSLVGSEDGNLLYIQGGNDQLTSALLESAGAVVKFNTQIKTIEKIGCRYRIDSFGEFDAVFLALPLEGSGINFDGFGAEFIRPPTRAYRTTHSNFIVSNGINPQYFLPSTLTVDQLLTTEGVPFSSVAYKGVTNDGMKVYKVFSRTPLSPELISSLFINGSLATSFSWEAYPVLAPIPMSASPLHFVLSPNLIYLNVFESAISCMETSVMAAKNAVNLLSKSFIPQ